MLPLMAGRPSWRSGLTGPSMGNRIPVKAFAILTGIVALLVGGFFGILGAQHGVQVQKWHSLRIEQMETGLTFPLKLGHLETLGPGITAGWVHADTGGIKHLSATGNLVACVTGPDGALRTTVLDFRGAGPVEAGPEVVAQVAEAIPEYTEFCARVRAKPTSTSKG